MHIFPLGNRLSRWLAVAALGLLAAPAAQAQLSGTKAIPGDYSTVAGAITALNAQGVGAGGVTFNIAAGYAETFGSPTAGAITATGTAANPIVFQKSGSGANPKITAGVGTSSTLDAIISLAGSDYVTIDGLDVAESAANATATTQMEFGYALARASSGTNGAQFNIIRNCVVTLNKTNPGTIGIAGLNSPTASSAAGSNSGNKFYGNVVTNALIGIYLNASTTTAVSFYDQNNEIGVTAGNTIGNFGGTASGYGAGGAYQNGLKVSGNTINSTLNYTSATTSTPVAASTVTSTLRGIYTPNGTSSNLDITNNTITLASGATTSQLSGIENAMGSTAASNTVNITGNTLSMSYTTASSAVVYGINNTGSPTAVNITGNTLTATTLSNTGSTYLIYNNQSSGASTVANNQFSGVTRTGATGSVYGYYNNGGGTGTQTLTNNVFNNITVAGGATFYGLYNTSSASETQLWSGNQISNITAGTTPTGSLYGLYVTYGNTGSQFFNNTVTGLSGGSTVYGIYLANTGLSQAAVYGNTISGLSTSGASSTAYGIYTTAVTTPSIYRNKVYDLQATAATGTAYGLYNTGGSTITYYNNLVGDLRTPAATGLNAVAGLYISSGTTVNAYYNTINLNASSTGATFGTSGIYYTTTPGSVDLRNNIVVNKSTANGSGGTTVALRRSTGTTGTVPANLATTTNNNLYYAGTPSATNLIYAEGTTTNTQQTLAAYKAFMATRDAQAVTEDVAFLSTTGSAATFLHINPSVATQVEGAATPVSGITTDFDNDARSATTPDIGADEGTFTPQDLTGPSIVLTPLTNTSSTGNRTLTVTITDVSGLSTTAPPRLFYRKGTSGAYTSTLATSTSGSSFTFTIDAATLGGLATSDVVQYYVVAQDALGNVSSNPSGGTATTPPAAVYQYTVLNTLSGTYYVGSGASPDPTRTYATLTAAASAYNNNGLAGAVTFLLLDATYSTAETFPIAFNNNPEATAAYTLTIRPNTGVTSAITSTGSALAFSNARYITVDGSNVAGGTTRNLTVTSTSTTAGAYGIGLISTASTGPGNQFVTVRNTSVVSGSNTAATFGIYVGNGPDNDNITLTNNSIQGSYYGIYAFGSAPASAGGMDNFVVSNNVVGPATASASANIGTWGILVSNAVSPSITGNEVQNVSSANTSNIYGIYLSDAKSAVVSRNSVHNLSYTGTSSYKVWGINSVNTNLATAANPSAARIDNNLVYNLTATTVSATWNTVGINLGGGYGDQIVYNTVYLNGQLSAATSTGGSAAFANGNPSVTSVSTNIDVRNNIFSIIGGTGGTTTTPLYAHYEYAGSVTGSTLNYNDLYVTTGSTGLALIGHLGTTDYATLAQWRTATGQEANSVSVDPLFAQTTTTPYDLTPGANALNGTATSIAGVTVDYLGAPRGTTPDIGAYEFSLTNIDLKPLALLTPAVSGCYSAAETVTVQVQNSGTSTLNFATNPATVTAVVTTPGGSQTLTGTITSGTLAPGTNQTVTLTPTLDMTAVGTYSFAITATVQGDQVTGNDVLATVTRTVAAPVAGTLSAGGSICISGTTSLTLAGAANGSIQYQSSPDNVTFTDVAGATSATYTTPVLTSTTYYRAQVRCGTAVATSNVSTVTVNNPTVTATNTPLSICAGSTATLTATASAGSSVRFFSTATGGTALATTTPGSYTTPALTASTTYYAEAFSGGSSVAGLPDNAATYGTFGQFSASDYPLGFAVTQAGVLASVDVYPTAAGNLTLRLYSVAGTQPSGTTTTVAGSDVTIAVTTAQVGTRVTVPLNYSLAAGEYKLSNTVGGLGRFSTYTGTYPLTSSNGVLIVRGSYTFNSSSSYANATYNSFFNLTFLNDCVGATRTAIQVNVTQPATASFAAASGSSCGTSAYQLAGAVGGSATGGTYTSSGTGTFAPDASTLTATYTPSAADVAAGSVTITLTSSGSTPCPAATATFALSLTPTPVATFSYPAGTTYCAGSASTVAPTLGSGATAGTFSSTTGLTIDASTGVITLATSAAGTYTVTNSVAASGACAAASATATVTITPATSATFSYGGGTFCVTGSNPTATVTGTPGGTFSSTTGLSIDASTGAISLTASTPGTYTVTYTVAGPCGSSSSQSVTITTAPSAAFSYGTAPTFCVSGTTNPTPSFGAGASGGVFSSTTGLTIDATTGAITLSSSTPGTYTVTNTIAANGGCAAASATAQVTITAAPLATFSYGAASTFCVSGTTNPAVVLGTGATAGLFSSTTGLTINATTGAITLSSSTPGTYTVTNTVAAANGCAAASATTQVTITAAPLASFSYGTNSTFCVSGTVNPTVVLGTGATAGTFSSTTGLTINASTGAITLSSSTPGTYTVTNTVAAANGCAAATATTQVTITTAPTATFSYATASGCVGSTGTATPTLATGAMAGTFSSTTGLTINATTGVITLSSSTAGTYTVTNAVAAASGCAAATATTTFTVNPRPATPTLSATYNGATTTLTSSAATGNQFYLNGALIAGATGQTYVVNGTTQLGSYTVTTTNTNGCVSQPSLPLVVTATKTGLAGASLRLYPNPTPSGQVTLELTGYRSATQLTVLDALGRVVSQQLLPANAGTATRVLDLSGAPTGVYLLRLSNADGVETRRLVRE